MRIVRSALLVVCAFGVSTAWAQRMREIREPVNVSRELDALSAQLPESAARLDPELNRAVEWVQQRRYVEALTILRAKVRRDPDNLDARSIAVTALIGLRQYAAAQTLMQQMLEKYPNNPVLLNNLAWLYATADAPPERNPERALSFARRAVLLSPNSYNIWSTLAEAHYANRDFVRSLRAVEEAQRLSIEQHASPAQQVVYEYQVFKCNNAMLAFSIFE